MVRDPVIETSRLLLREFSVADGHAMYRLNLDPLVMQYTGDKPFGSVAQAESFMAAYSHYRIYGFGRWAVIRKSDSAFLGWCGLKYNEVPGEHDVGFRFFRKFWNQGYATESAKASIEYGFEKLKLPRITGRAMPGNAASIRVLEKCGLVFRESVEENGLAWRVYAISAEDHLAKRGHGA